MKSGWLYFIPTWLGLLTFANQAAATDVEVTGLFSNKAMVVINGGRPRMLSAGQATPDGVKLISANSSAAVLEIDGKRQTVTMGQSISTSFINADKPTVKLTANEGGHFTTMGSINGYPIRFMVDTGATMVAISAAEATRMGIDYHKGERGASSTANGIVPTYKVILDNVKLGGISLNYVEAAVIEGAGMEGALLGNSFLSRLEMKREGTVLTLTKTY